MAEEKTPNAEASLPEAALPEAAPLDTERAVGSVIPLIFGLIATLSTAGLLLSLKTASHRWGIRHSGYMPPNVTKGYTQQANNGPINSTPVGPPRPGSPPRPIDVQITLYSSVTQGDKVTLSSTYTYVDGAGTHADNSLPLHVFNYLFPNFCVLHIPNVASDWTSLTVTMNFDLEYKDGTGDTFTLTETVFTAHP